MGTGKKDKGKKTDMQIYNCSVIYILLKLSKTVSCEYDAFKS